MSLVNFSPTAHPCIDNPITRWHVAHGWCYNAVDVRSGNFLGVFYVTLLCADGGIIHFDTCSSVPPALILSGFRKALRMVLPHLAVVYATVPAGSIGLVRVLKKLGFRVVPEGGFVVDSREILLLKYFNKQNAIFL
ncbi:MAG: hypothetical protein IJY46_07810 [Lentisphaeria bacterium]|nr:hypothetical protein [Lentisphaeria bacterium]